MGDRLRMALEPTEEAIEWMQAVLDTAGDNFGPHTKRQLSRVLAAARRVLDARPLQWCEKHQLPRAEGLEPVCVVAYMPLFDADEDLPCRIVPKLLVDAAVGGGLIVDGERGE